MWIAEPAFDRADLVVGRRRTGGDPHGELPHPFGRDGRLRVLVGDLVADRVRVGGAQCLLGRQGTATRYGVHRVPPEAADHGGSPVGAADDHLPRLELDGRGRGEQHVGEVRLQRERLGHRFAIGRAGIVGIDDRAHGVAAACEREHIAVRTRPGRTVPHVEDLTAPEVGTRRVDCEHDAF